MKQDSLQNTSLDNANRMIASDLNNSRFSVYANPVNDILPVQVKGTATLSLTDVAGRILLTKTISNSSTINTSHLQAGMYYLRNHTAGETRKVFVSH